PDRQPAQEERTAADWRGGGGHAFGCPAAPLPHPSLPPRSARVLRSSLPLGPRALRVPTIPPDGPGSTVPPHSENTLPPSQPQGPASRGALRCLPPPISFR